ncbi:MAG: hypothetical protein KDE19_10070 [Caldilineaceae bacterium]|nr:hypothetical protein [Caldilineaceae bacterium]
MKEVFVEEAINALVRVMKDGSIHPTSFLWRDRTRYVADLGRQWEERVAGKTVRFYLVQTVDGNTFELTHDPAENQWMVKRAWLRDVIV